MTDETLEKIRLMRLKAKEKRVQQIEEFLRRSREQDLEIRGRFQALNAGRPAKRTAG